MRGGDGQGFDDGWFVRSSAGWASILAGVAGIWLRGGVRGAQERGPERAVPDAGAAVRRCGPRGRVRASPGDRRRVSRRSRSRSACSAPSPRRATACTTCRTCCTPAAALPTDVPSAVDPRGYGTFALTGLAVIILGPARQSLDGAPGLGRPARPRPRRRPGADVPRPGWSCSTRPACSCSGRRSWRPPQPDLLPAPRRLAARLAAVRPARSVQFGHEVDRNSAPGKERPGPEHDPASRRRSGGARPARERRERKPYSRPDRANAESLSPRNRVGTRATVTSAASLVIVRSRLQTCLPGAAGEEEPAPPRRRGDPQR